MTVTRCEGCGKEEKVTPADFGLAPAGWFRVTERKPRGGTADPRDFCGLACLTAWAYREGGRVDEPEPGARLIAEHDAGKHYGQAAAGCVLCAGR